MCTRRKKKRKKRKKKRERLENNLEGGAYWNVLHTKLQFFNTVEIPIYVNSSVAGLGEKKVDLVGLSTMLASKTRTYRQFLGDFKLDQGHLCAVSFYGRFEGILG